MHSAPGLPALGLVASYYLRVLGAYLLCLLVSRTCVQPRTRFVVWASFLMGSGIYWIFLVVRGLGASPGTGLGEPNGFAADLVTTASLSIPSEWGYGIDAAIRILAYGYVIGLVILLLAMLQRRLRLWLILRRATPASRELDDIFSELCRELSQRRCRLRVLPGLTSPATAYSWRPRIVVPELFGDYLDRAQWADVLTHELMHVARRDYLWSTVSDLIRCLLFFHPAIWLASRSLGRERELACDAAVVGYRRDRLPDYAECLTRLARMRLAEQRTRAAINLATSGSFLGLRVRALLRENQRRSWWKRGAALATRLAVLTAFLAVWPALAVVLRYAPPAVTEALLTGGHPISTHRRAQRHRRAHTRRSLTASPIGAAERSQAKHIPDLSSSVLSTAIVPASAGLVRKTPRPVPDIPEMTASATSDGPSGRSTPEIPTSPVWTESSPSQRSTTSPSWERTAIGAAATLGRVVTLGGGEGSDQEGNHLLPRVVRAGNLNLSAVQHPYVQ